MQDIFGYDDGPLDLLDQREEVTNGVRIHDISYSALKGLSVSAFLVVPTTTPSYAGLIFLHGAGQSRVDFLTEAISLAQLGAVSLLIDVPFVRSAPQLTRPESDRRKFIETIIASRRGIDLLVAQADVDPDRLGCVAISLGAWFGGVLAGVEKRLKTYVLMTALPGIRELLDSTAYPAAVQPYRTLTSEQIEQYQELLEPLDATNYINRASPSSLLFQFARQDTVVPTQVALRYDKAASEPKVTKWYDIGHPQMSYHVAARRDRFKWLSTQLQIEYIEE